MKKKRKPGRPALPPRERSVQASISFPADIDRAIRKAMKRTGASRSRIVQDCIRQTLDPGPAT